MGSFVADKASTMFEGFWIFLIPRKGLQILLCYHLMLKKRLTELNVFFIWDPDTLWFGREFLQLDKNTL